MPYSPVLVVHICAGTVGLLSWHCSNVLPQRLSPSHPSREGVRRIDAGHGCRRRVLGNCEESIKQHLGRNPNLLPDWNWVANGKTKEGEVSRMDWLVLLIPLTLGILIWINGIEVIRSGATSVNGVPVGMNFFMGTICLLAATGDVRVLMQGGVFGVRRILRHSLANVFWVVHRSRVIFHGAIEPAIEIAFDSWSRAAPSFGAIQHRTISIS